ncbi:ankyrin repeat-containing protein NPR4-like [Coffea eugenioides]|uniref:ankyrin repeat-containing protein NPR4-like n=1 Tax=Coffea eugenioides TaxID=49369 RepID=UPI000F60CC36|nr:ankyrin repeat-containing protein NPR4-like [Coffea eugenioides]
MDRRLCEAALEGDVTTFYQLIQEDPLALHKAALKCEDKNPLHLAAILGHVDFVKAILQIESAHYMCWARDRDGRNPLHLAAMYGKLPVLLLLIRTGFRAALEKTDGGGTVLHLCIKYNQLEALKILVDKLKDPEFVNAKNEDGMTILHLAVYYEQYETIKYLLFNAGVEVNIKNANGKTALDLLFGQGVTKSSEISSCLQEAGALKAKEIRSPIDDRKLKQLEWFEKSREAIMVVAILIATMAFQAGISPPGGVWQDDLLEGPNPHTIGEAVMAQKHPKYYWLLIRANTIAFVSSLSTIILLIRGSSIPSKCLMPLLAFVMWLAIATIAITYAIALITVAPKEARGRQLGNTSEILVIVLMVWSGWIVTTLYEINALFKKWLKIHRMDSRGYLFSDLVRQVFSRVSLRAPRSSGGVTPSTPSGDSTRV